ncbi:MAG: YcxB family protein [Opitutaceae bacterium]|jgi:hypothetical protein|nr:YcxB family protein [Opitutaceae bacterium]
MTIDCNLTFEDLVAFNLYHWKNTPVLRRRRLLAVCILSSIAPFVTAYGLYSELGGGSTWADAFVLHIPALLVSMAIPFLLRWSFRHKIRNTVRIFLKGGKNRMVIGPRNYIITNENITESTEISRQTLDWAGVEKIASDGNYIYIYNTTASAHVIPRQSITNGADFDEAWRMIQECYNSRAPASREPSSL